MKLNVIRRGPALALALAGIVSFCTLMTAQQKAPVERFVATSVNVTGAGDTIKIDLLRWSTDEERTALFTVFTGKPEDLFGALDKAPTLGYIWTSESIGYSIRYAYRMQLPNGGERVVLATNRRLGAGNPQIWKPVGTVGSTDYPFTLIEMSLNSRGEGEGKASITAKLTADNSAKTIALEKYAEAPVVLKGVKRVTSPS